MKASSELSKNIDQINSVIELANGDSEIFAETLRHKHIPHLSFSKVTSAEFCEYRYYLQYIELVDPSPTPEYFTKGKLMHELIAASYSRLANGEEILVDALEGKISDHYNSGESYRHLQNALVVHLQNMWTDCDVIAVEEPFVMEVDPDLPPCVGVIDLVLKRDDEFIIVDHKTGRDFYPLDELQMGIYVQYLQQKYGRGKFSFFYDSYRWVNNLDRIRKPAFQRSAVSLQKNFWPTALERIRHGNAVIQSIERRKSARKYGECFRCPYKNNCW